MSLEKLAAILSLPYRIKAAIMKIIKKKPREDK